MSSTWGTRGRSERITRVARFRNWIIYFWPLEMTPLWNIYFTIKLLPFNPCHIFDATTASADTRFLSFSPSFFISNWNLFGYPSLSLSLCVYMCVYICSTVLQNFQINTFPVILLTFLIFQASRSLKLLWHFTCPPLANCTILLATSLIAIYLVVK